MTSKCLRQNNKTQNTKKNTLEYLGTVLHRNQGYGRTEPSGNQSRSVAKSNRNVFGSTFLFVGKMENRCVENACRGNEERGEDPQSVLLGVGGR